MILLVCVVGYVVAVFFRNQMIYTFSRVAIVVVFFKRISRTISNYSNMLSVSPLLLLIQLCCTLLCSRSTTRVVVIHVFLATSQTFYLKCCQLIHSITVSSVKQLFHNKWLVYKCTDVIGSQL